MKLPLVTKALRAIISFALYKLFFLANTAIATTFTTSGKNILINQPSGSWVLVEQFTLSGAPPKYDGMKNGCSGLGSDGQNYAACANGEVVHTPNHPGDIAGTLIKNTGTLSGPNGSTMEVGVGFKNMGLFFGGQKWNSGYADARATIIPLPSNLEGPGDGSVSENYGWGGGNWLLHQNNGCTIFNACDQTKGIAALIPYNATYGNQATGTISLYIRVPDAINAGTYTGTVSFGTVQVRMDMGGSGTYTYSASISGKFEVNVPQRCNMTFPGSVSFDTINGGTQSTTPLQTKSVTFTSECTGLAQATVKAELLLESNSFDAAIGAVMLDTEKTLGVKASLNPSINCSSASDELFNNQSLLLTHPKSTGTSTLSKDIYIALCKYGLTTKPGDYSKSINAKVIYSTTP